MADSSGLRAKRQDFPLFRHQRGHWAKKVLGKMRYFGRIDADPDGQKALERWLYEKDYLLAGVDPPEKGTTYTSLKDISNAWFNAKLALLRSGDLAQRTIDEYRDTCEFLLKQLGRLTPAGGIAPDHFNRVREALGKKYNPNGQSKRITQIKAIFNDAYHSRLLDQPPNFGRALQKPKAKAFRKLRAAKGDQSFSREQVLTLLDHSDVNLRPMVLLALQAGFGNEDVAALPREAIRRNEWLEWARIKTAIARRVPLWPETRQALEAAIEHANSKGEASLCFVSSRGLNYISPKLNGYRVHGLFKTAERKANTGRTFYDLRRTFATVAGDLGDQQAVDAIMGHAPRESDMAARYRQRISDSRLRAVVDHVHSWLWPAELGGNNRE
jgi:integrase